MRRRAVFEVLTKQTGCICVRDAFLSFTALIFSNRLSRWVSESVLPITKEKRAFGRNNFGQMYSNPELISPSFISCDAGKQTIHHLSEKIRNKNNFKGSEKYKNRYDKPSLQQSFPLPEAVSSPFKGSSYFLQITI